MMYYKINPPFTPCGLEKRRKGFTLIELLTVIAIIAILASILIVVTRQTKNSTLRVKSLSNIRQVGQLALLYATTNNGRLPYASGNRNSSSVPPEEQHDNWIIELRNAGYKDIITLYAVAERPDSAMFCPMALACRPHSDNASYNWAMNTFIGNMMLASVQTPAKTALLMNSRWVPSQRTWGQTEVGATNAGPNRLPDFPYPIREMSANAAPDSGAPDPSTSVFFIDGRVDLVSRSNFPDDVNVPFWTGKYAVN